MSDIEKFKSKLLKKLGYDVVPFYGDSSPKYVIFKDDDAKFHFYDGQANESHRESDEVRGDILVMYDGSGFHYCPSTNSEGEYIHYSSNNRDVMDYFILWNNDEYIKLNYLYLYGLKYGSSFYYTNNEHYFAIKYHCKDLTEQKRCEEKPLLETIIPKEKDICHIEVFTYYFKDKIVVYDKEENIIVYDEEFNVLYEDYGDFQIWEKDSLSYLIIPNRSVLVELSEGKIIKLSEEDSCWDKVMAYKDIFVLYTEHHYPVERSDWDGETYWEYDNENAPIERTDGCIYDMSFKLIRKINVFGEILNITEFANMMVIEVDDSDYRNCITKFFNVYGANITNYNEDTGEEFSVPDITFTSMDGYEHLGLAVVRTLMYTPDIIFFGSSSKNKVISKCGVYKELGGGYSYEKIIDCKYDNVKSMPLKSDYNIYYIGIIGGDSDNKCDLYVNNKLFFNNYPYNRGHAIEVVGSGYFIKYTDSDGNIGFIRNGEIAFKSQHEDAKVCVWSNGREEDDELEFEYLFIVSNGDLYGICSPSGELILPIEYPIIDIDDNLTIVIAKRVDEMEIDENDKSILWDYQMEIGYFSKETNSIETEKAIVDDNGVRLDDNYVWDGEFKYTKEYYDE